MRYRGEQRERGREKEEVSHNGRRMSKKRTVNGQRNQRGGRKGVGLEDAFTGRSTHGHANKSRKGEWKIPSSALPAPTHPASLPFFPSFPFFFSSFRFLRCSLARDFPLPNRHCARSLAQPNCNGICLRAEEES